MCKVTEDGAAPGAVGRCDHKWVDERVDVGDHRMICVRCGVVREIDGRDFTKGADE